MQGEIVVDQAEIGELKGRLRQAVGCCKSGDALFVPKDVSRRENVVRAVDSTENRWGGVDGSWTTPPS